MLEESDEVMVDGVQVGDGRTEVVAVIPQQHLAEGDRRGAETGDDHADADHDPPEPCRPPARVGRHIAQTGRWGRRHGCLDDPVEPTRSRCDENGGRGHGAGTGGWSKTLGIQRRPPADTTIAARSRNPAPENRHTVSVRP